MHGLSHRLAFLLLALTGAAFALAPWGEAAQRLALALAAAILLRASRREAGWNRALPLRQEG